MIISDFEFGLARRNAQNVAQANVTIDEASRRIVALQRRLAVAEKRAAIAEAENFVLRSKLSKLQTH